MKTTSVCIIFILGFLSTTLVFIDSAGWGQTPYAPCEYADSHGNYYAYNSQYCGRYPTLFFEIINEYVILTSSVVGILLVCIAILIDNNMN